MNRTEPNRTYDLLYQRHTLYQSATATCELLILTEGIRSLILNRSAASTIAQLAVEQGMRSLRHDGWEKVLKGETTIEEVMRVTQTEEHLGLIEEN